MERCRSIGQSPKWALAPTEGDEEEEEKEEEEKEEEEKEEEEKEEEEDCNL